LRACTSERHLPGTCFGLHRRGSLRSELPEGVRLEEVMQQVLERVRRDRLKLPIEIEGSRRRRSGNTRLAQAPERGVTRSSPMYSLSAYIARGPLW